MSLTVHKAYLGWDITIRCSTRASTGESDPAMYTAMAEAELQLSENPDDWVDPRLQLISTGNRYSSSKTDCIDKLFLEIKELIDALQR
jgi:hypothetical protein